MRNSSVLTVFLLAAVCPQRADAQGELNDAEIGVKLKAPSGWAFLGREGDLGSLRAMYCAPREYEAKSGLPHTPALRVLFFPKGRTAPAAAQGELPQRGPYASFSDYIERVYGPRVRKVSADDQTYGKASGKLVVTANGPLALVDFVVPTDAGEVVFELEVLDEHRAKVTPEVEKALNTIAMSPPGSAAAAPEPPPWVTDFAAWQQRSKEDRAKARQEYGAKLLAQASAHLEPGWKASKIGTSYLMVSRADAKATKRITDAVTAGRAWAEAHFANVSDEAVSPVVVRVFANQREHDAYRSRDVLPMPYDAERREILFFHDADAGNTGEEFGVLLRGIALHYLDEKDPHIARNLPRWFDHGLAELLRSTKVKGNKLEFLVSETEKGRFAYYAEKGLAIPTLWELIQELILPLPTNGDDEQPWGYTTECARLFRWLEAGGGEALGSKDFVVKYLQAVAKAAAAMPPDPGLTVELSRLTDGQRQDLNKQVFGRRNDLLIKINDIACPLQVPEWQKANEAWIAYCDKLKS